MTRRATACYGAGLLYAVLVVGLLGVSSSCGADDVVESAAAVPTGPMCGDTTRCVQSEFCVTSQGALCAPLPPPGGSCPAGCELTEHCCNCSVDACVAAPSEPCPQGPRCDCLAAVVADGHLRGCPEDGRQCAQTVAGVQVLCVVVGLDENPFADAGLDGAAD